MDTADARFGGIARLYGKDGLAKLGAAHVAVIGVGGVGSWSAEALARSGIGQLTLVDLDEVRALATDVMERWLKKVAKTSEGAVTWAADVAAAADAADRQAERTSPEVPSPSLHLTWLNAADRQRSARAQRCPPLHFT